MEKDLWPAGEYNHWPLAEALKWRTEEFGLSPDEAFAELAGLMAVAEDQCLIATGVMYKHACPEKEIEPYRVWRDPPTSIPFTTFGLKVMPVDEWSGMAPKLDDAGGLTNDLKCATCRLLAWRRVEFLDRYTLARACRPVAQLAGALQKYQPVQPNELELSRETGLEVKSVIPNALIEKYFRIKKAEGEPLPPADASVSAIANLHPRYHVPRAKVRAAHKAVFGKLLPGKRSRTA